MPQSVVTCIWINCGMTLRHSIEQTQQNNKEHIMAVLRTRLNRIRQTLAARKERHERRKTESVCTCGSHMALKRGSIEQPNDLGRKGGRYFSTATGFICPNRNCGKVKIIKKPTIKWFPNRNIRWRYLRHSAEFRIDVMFYTFAHNDGVSTAKLAEHFKVEQERRARALEGAVAPSTTLKYFFVFNHRRLSGGAFFFPFYAFSV